jgi:hypothetical protein
MPDFVPAGLGTWARIVVSAVGVMRMRGLGMLAVGVAIGTAVLTCVIGTSAAMAGPVSPQAGGPGSQLWVSRYNGPLNGFDGATATAISPGGGTLFVTGQSDGSNAARDYATVAYNTATGTQLWATRYNGPADEGDLPYAVAASPGGGMVYVTGVSEGATTSLDYATIAYDAATGARVWVRRYHGPAASVDFAKALAVSPDGNTVYVTGYSGQGASPSAHADYVTIAYNAATGAQRWLSRYNGRANQNDQARSVAVSPGGRTVYVTGRSYGRTSFYDYATVAYNAATGARRWVSRYNGRANMNEFANAVTAGPGGRTVYVTGGSRASAARTFFATVAYNADTGARRWVSRYNGPGHIQDSGRSLAVTPDSRTVIVTGSSFGLGQNANRSTATDYATIAYNAATGARLWIRRYAGTPDYAEDDPASVAVSPSGDTVFVTGTSWGGNTTQTDFATIAYRTATGARLWVSRYNGPASGVDGGSAMVVSSAGGAVYVTGRSTGTTSNADFTTIAYRT